MFRINYHSIFTASRPVDFRKSFDGLSGEVRNALEKDPLDGSLFVFFNKRMDSVKMLLWDGDGFWLFYKKLEVGTFQFPLQCSSESPSVAVGYDELQCILSGIEITRIHKRKRYEHSKIYIDI
jgi:transposase